VFPCYEYRAARIVFQKHDKVQVLVSVRRYRYDDESGMNQSKIV
jgi:hypothetical protein